MALAFQAVTSWYLYLGLAYVYDYWLWISCKLFYQCSFFGVIRRTVFPEYLMKPHFWLASIWHWCIPCVLGICFTFHQSPVNSCYKILLQHRHYSNKCAVAWACHILGAKQRAT